MNNYISSINHFDSFYFCFHLILSWHKYLYFIYTQTGTLIMIFGVTRPSIALFVGLRYLFTQFDIPVRRWDIDKIIGIWLVNLIISSLSPCTIHYIIKSSHNFIIIIIKTEGFDYIKCEPVIFYSVCLKFSHFSQLSFIQYTGLCVFSLLSWIYDICHDMFKSFNHHQVGSINRQPLLRVRS